MNFVTLVTEVFLTLCAPHCSRFILLTELLTGGTKLDHLLALLLQGGLVVGHKDIAVQVFHTPHRVCCVGAGWALKPILPARLFGVDLVQTGTAEGM